MDISAELALFFSSGVNSSRKSLGELFGIKDSSS